MLCLSGLPKPRKCTWLDRLMSADREYTALLQTALHGLYEDLYDSEYIWPAHKLFFLGGRGGSWHVPACLHKVVFVTLYFIIAHFSYRMK